MSKRTNTETITITKSALEALVADAVRAGVTQALAGDAKAPRARKASAKKTPAKDESFVEYLRDSAEARKARKESNADLSAWLKAKKLPIGGEVWSLAKAGERRVTVLRAAAKRDAKARAAAKA